MKFYYLSLISFKSSPLFLNESVFYVQYFLWFFPKYLELFCWFLRWYCFLTHGEYYADWCKPFLQGIHIRRNLEELNQETVVAMERHKNVKLNNQERQLLVLPGFSRCLTNSASPNLPVVAINIPLLFVCSCLWLSVAPLQWN